MPFLLLTLSIVLSSFRGILSKKLSHVSFGTKSFYNRQAILFIFGALSILAFGNISFTVPAPITVIYAVIYALLLIFAQWFYTVALGGENTALATTVYSMGFIFPTLSGALLWNEVFTFFDLLGIVCAIIAITVSGKPKSKFHGKGGRFFIPLLIATLSSGGLGIMQKVQQRSDYASEKSVFLIIAFILAGVISFIFSLTVKSEKKESEHCSIYVIAASIGIAFGSCNLLNTLLAGLLESTIFFPTLNIGVILLTMLLCALIYKEKIRRREATVLAFGVLSIMLLNFG